MAYTETEIKRAKELKIEIVLCEFHKLRRLYLSSGCYFSFQDKYTGEDPSLSTNILRCLFLRAKILQEFTIYSVG